jgi:hypothetical protein
MSSRGAHIWPPKAWHSGPKDNAGVARCDHGIAYCYLRIEKPAAAIEVIAHGLKLSEARDYKVVSMDLFRGLGVAQTTLGNLDAAASATERSLSRCRLHPKKIHSRCGNKPNFSTSSPLNRRKQPAANRLKRRTT